MAYNTLLHFDSDPFEEILKEATEEKLLELLHIYLKFQEINKAEAVQREMDARREKNSKN